VSPKEAAEELSKFREQVINGGSASINFEAIDTAIKVMGREETHDPVVSDVFNVAGDTMCVELMYPGLSGRPEFVEVGLTHVRAADSIRISYDFGRDGWKVEQAQVFAWVEGMDPGNYEWKEVGFFEAWASQRHVPELGDICTCDVCEEKKRG